MAAASPRGAAATFSGRCVLWTDPPADPPAESVVCRDRPPGRAFFGRLERASAASFGAWTKAPSNLPHADSRPPRRDDSIEVSAVGASAGWRGLRLNTHVIAGQSAKRGVPATQEHRRPWVLMGRRDKPGDDVEWLDRSTLAHRQRRAAKVGAGVGEQRLAGDMAGGGRGQEHRRAGEVLGRRGHLQRRSGGGAAADALHGLRR